jgi:uncharacterized membrane protein YdbT with pleckstrin-like domain
MPDETLWRGNTSQWKNFGFFVVQAAAAALVLVIIIAIWRGSSPEVRRFVPYILLLLAVPIFMALKRYLQTKNQVYELTTERLKMSKGVLSKITDSLELYRVKDWESRQPFLYRIVGIENVQLNTSDASSPLIILRAIPAKVGLGDKIRNQVEAIRAQKGVREIDVE